jgi:hypothetical protein
MALGKVPLTSRGQFGVVDVRDTVAWLKAAGHLRP